MIQPAADNPVTLDMLADQLAAVARMAQAAAEARRNHAETLLELKHDVGQLLEWFRALDFDGRGVILQDDAPPILRLLKALIEDNQVLRLQNEQIIANTSALIGEPTNEEAAALYDAQAAGGASIPKLLDRFVKMDQSIKQLRLNGWLTAVGLAVTLGLLILHHVFIVQQFSSAMGWLVSLFR